MNHHALIATARYHGEVVQERLEPGPPVSIGNGPPLALPLPEGVAHLAHVEWGRGGRPRIVDAMGRQYLLEPEEALEMELGDIHVELELTPQFTLRRTDAVSWRLSIGWLVVVLLFTISTSWYDTIKQHRCEIFGFSPELSIVLGCVQAQANNSGAGELTAEYLARLLKEDYAGEEDGYLQREERPNEGRERQDIFLPSGNRGPIEKMGGAEEAGPEVLKAPRTEELPQPEKKEAAKKEELQVLELPEDIGTPIEAAPVDGLSDQADGEGQEDEQLEDDEGQDVPTEETEGWGLQDWYDEKDAAIDEIEIQYTIKIAERRLKIDPDDPDALSLLSYYQYLDEDYDGALKTYDRYIELLPDSAAGYNNKALVYKRRGDYQTEEALYRVALSLEPMDVTAMNNLGVNLAHQKRFDEALAVMRQLEVLDPDDAYADLHRAKIHAEMGNDAEALRYLRKSLEGMKQLDTLHHIEFRQDIRLDPSFAKLRESREFRAILLEYYGDDAPVVE